MTVRARAGFESVVTGKGWREEFVYVVGFEAGEGEGGGGEEGMEGGEGRGGETRKIKRLDLWADPLSAWIAVGGEDVDVGVGVVGVGEEGKGKKEKT